MMRNLNNIGRPFADIAAAAQRPFNDFIGVVRHCFWIMLLWCQSQG